MNEVESEVVRRRLLSMRELVTHLQSLGPIEAHDLEENLGLRLQVSMALAQVVTLATEVNSHVVARRTGRPPGDLRESFTRMAEVGWIDRDCARALRESPGMRNVLLHEYVRVDLEMVADAIPKAVEQYGHYIRQVAARLPES